MPCKLSAQHWPWLWLALGGVTIGAGVFAIWEVTQQGLLPNLDGRSIYSFYITRGIALAFLLAAWSTGIIMTHRRSCAAQLRRAEMEYRQLIDAAGDAIVVMDRQGIVREWNPQAARLFGFSRDEVLGRVLPTLLDDAKTDFFALLGKLAAGNEVSGLKYASQRLTKRGEVVDVSLSLSPLRDERGEVTTFLETSCDIRGCAQLVRKMQQVEKMSGMGQLAAGVAHQLNTPLASALLRAQMLEEDVQAPEQIDELRFIQQQLRYGKEIVEGLLRFSRPSKESKRPELLNPILQGVLKMMEPSARSAKVRLHHNLTASERVLVYVGRNELEQVFFNMCHNAFDAMPHGGELTIITQMRQERFLTISFSDTGIGIPHARLPRIFEPFFTTKEPGKGTGLGLAICQRIIEDAGGTIDATSVLGQGSTFTIQLPMAGMTLGTEAPVQETVAAVEAQVPLVMLSQPRNHRNDMAGT